MKTRPHPCEIHVVQLMQFLHCSFFERTRTRFCMIYCAIIIFITSDKAVGEVLCLSVSESVCFSGRCHKRFLMNVRLSYDQVITFYD